jgi:hypothetical protein
VKIPVTRRALTQRINRVLAKENQKLLASRSWGAKSNLGDYHIVDTYRNAVVDYHIDLVKLAKEMHVLADWEKLEDE